MVLGRYDSTGTGILAEQDKARLVEDARAAQTEARKKFLMQFDKDGDGKLSPEEYKAFREHVEKLSLIHISSMGSESMPRSSAPCVPISSRTWMTSTRLLLPSPER